MYFDFFSMATGEYFLRLLEQQVDGCTCVCLTNLCVFFFFFSVKFFLFLLFDYKKGNFWIDCCIGRWGGKARIAAI